MRFSCVFGLVGAGLFVGALITGVPAQARPYTNLVTIMEGGQVAPGGGIYTNPAAVAAPLTLSANGSVAFRTSGAAAAVYVSDGTTGRRIVGIGDTVNGNAISGLGAISDNPYINAGGDVVVRATLPSNGSGVFRYTSATTSLSTVATNTTIAPTFNNTTVPYGTLGRATINDGGTIAFTSVNGMFTQTSAGVYDDPVIVGALGSTGAPGVGIYGTVANARINNAGVIVHNGTGDTGSGFVNKMIQTTSTGFTSVIAEIGGAAPGGGTFSSFSTNNAYISGTSRFATMRASTSDAASPTGLFRWDTQAGSLIRLVGENQATGFGGFWSSFDPVGVTNNNGLTLFSAGIEDTAGTVFDAGLFATDGVTTFKVLGFSDLFKGGVLTTLGSNFALNDANQFVFNYGLEDGRQGIARAEIAVVVPEPGAGLLACMALPLLLLARRHRRERAQDKRD